MTDQTNDPSASAAPESAAESTTDQVVLTTGADKPSLSKQAGYSTDMKSSIEELPTGFDYSPSSIAKVAMMDNPSHPDLIGAARTVLKNAGVPEDRLAIMDRNCLIRSAVGKSVLAQRSALNGFWHVQFATLSNEGYGARQLLTDVGNDVEWIKWFSTLPLDMILKHNMPVSEKAPV